MLNTMDITIPSQIGMKVGIFETNLPPHSESINRLLL